ncbi:MAG: TM0106 family RecB-like putative nuclease [Candidatus Brocadiaceae bacterium]|nr:TM0106 family RecB-like putative nuclease [Candidatus Brocadiaceae bacterium]
MQITEEIFKTFLKCKTKCYLRISGTVGLQPEFGDWERFLAEDFQQKCSQRLLSNFRQDECFVGTPSPQEIENKKYRIVINCVVQAQRVQSHIQALERLPSPGNTKHNYYIPIRFIPKEKITAQQATPTQPQLILNKHCAECEFQLQCHQSAIQKDELTLLSGMTEKERCKLHSRGLFTITQLSFTFRPRRRSKRSLSKPNKYYASLKALAIREQKIHVAGKQELDTGQTPVYIDVEGVPDRDLYYLIGLRIQAVDSYVQHSFWANDLSEEKEIWVRFLQTISKVENPRLIHYGSYETLFLKRMKARYPEAIEDSILLDRLIAECVNILSVIYAHIYFPTYSNGLKDIARYLGFRWSDTNASGSSALVWRSKWEFSREPGLKHKLLTYNTEDCEALERVSNAVSQLCQRETEEAKSKKNEIVYTETLKRESPYHYGRNKFSILELEYINKSAYWDYQREKIYFRSKPKLKRVSKKSTKLRNKASRVNQTVQCLPPTCCPKCKSIKFFKHSRHNRIIYDLKFGRTSIKRWIVKYDFHRYFCLMCKTTFFSKKKCTRSKYGSELTAYIIYQIIELHIPQIIVVKSIEKLFGLYLGYGGTHAQKSDCANFYKKTYEGLIGKIIREKLIHVDETKVSIKGEGAFVWVFTSTEEVFYYYTETREGDFIQNLLREFKQKGL